MKAQEQNQSLILQANKKYQISNHYQESHQHNPEKIDNNGPLIKVQNDDCGNIGADQKELSVKSRMSSASRIEKVSQDAISIKSKQKEASKYDSNENKISIENQGQLKAKEASRLKQKGKIRILQYGTSKAQKAGKIQQRIEINIGGVKLKLKQKEDMSKIHKNLDSLKAEKNKKDSIRQSLDAIKLDQEYSSINDDQKLKYLVDRIRPYIKEIQKITKVKRSSQVKTENSNTQSVDKNAKTQEIEQNVKEEQKGQTVSPVFHQQSKETVEQVSKVFEKQEEKKEQLKPNTAEDKIEQVEIKDFQVTEKASDPQQIQHQKSNKSCCNSVNNQQNFIENPSQQEIQSTKINQISNQIKQVNQPPVIQQKHQSIQPSEQFYQYVQPEPLKEVSLSQNSEKIQEELIKQPEQIISNEKSSLPHHLLEHQKIQIVTKTDSMQQSFGNIVEIPNVNHSLQQKLTPSLPTLKESSEQVFAPPPVYQEQSQKQERMDTALSSNVYNISIGEILVPNFYQQSQKLLTEIHKLKQKINEIQHLKQRKPSFNGRFSNLKTKKQRKSRQILSQTLELRQSRSIYSDSIDSSQLNFTPHQAKDTIARFSYQAPDKQKPFRLKRHKQSPLNMKITRSSKSPIFSIPKPYPRQLTFQQDFKFYTDHFFAWYQHQLPNPKWTQQQLIKISTMLFSKLGEKVNEQSQQGSLRITKYKNCVEFMLDNTRTVHWHYDGRFYYGGWSQFGQKSGWGFDYYPQKYIFTGHFLSNKRNGYGIVKDFSEDGDVLYEGEWKNSMKHGVGKQREADGQEYIGDWQYGQKCGTGWIKCSESSIYPVKIEYDIQFSEESLPQKNLHELLQRKNVRRDKMNLVGHRQNRKKRIKLLEEI